MKQTKLFTYERNHIATFKLWLEVFEGIEDYTSVDLHTLDKYYCRYQCECVKHGFAYEHHSRFGVKGLFG